MSPTFKEKAKEIRKIKTKTLNSVLENSKFKDKKINLISIDVEGHELEVVRSIDLKKYTPEMIVIEFLDLKMKEIEFYNQDINVVLNSEVYKYMIKNDYYFVNWLGCDIIFVHKSIRD